MKDQKAPRNTTEDVKNNPMMALGIVRAEGAGQMIEGQEAAGQSSFVNSTALPTKIMTDDGKKALLSFGVVFGDEVEGDPMFQHVELPEGWKREGTGHNTHSDVLDEQGRKRIGVFYKAASYDRSAHLWVNRRYTFSHDYDRRDSENVGVTQVLDGNNVIHETEPIVIKSDDKGYEISERSNKLALAWLEEHYPDWDDPAAYWD